MNFFKLTFLPKLALAVISIIGIGYLIKLGQSILAPFFLAFLMAMLFLPLADFMERKLKFPRSFSTIASVMIMLTILTGMLYFFGSQLSSFSKDLPHLSKQFNLVFHNLQNWVSQTFNVKIDEQFDYLDQGLAKLLSSRSDFRLYFWSFLYKFRLFSIFHSVFCLYIKLQKNLK